jgi:secreted trypsin-like serine protease
MEFAAYLDLFSKGGYYTCGGSLIGKKTVVTAAHCFFEEDGSLSVTRGTVTIGRRDISNPPSKYVYNVAGVIRPKDFNPGAAYDLFGDIALIELDRTATTGKKIPLASFSTKVPQWFVTAGWGLTEDNRRSSDILRYAAVPSLSTSQLNAWVKYSGAYYQMESDHIAAGLGSDRADSCSGDSGGPLFKPGTDFTNSESDRDVLFGVVSYGLSSQCGPRQNMNIGFYTSIPYWRNWIKKEMKKRNWSL